MWAPRHKRPDRGKERRDKHDGEGKCPDQTEVRG